jgi:hypothetical protein
LPDASEAAPSRGRLNLFPRSVMGSLCSRVASCCRVRLQSKPHTHLGFEEKKYKCNQSGRYRSWVVRLLQGGWCLPIINDMRLGAPFGPLDEYLAVAKGRSSISACCCIVSWCGVFSYSLKYSNRRLDSLRSLSVTVRQMPDILHPSTTVYIASHV